MSTALAVVQQDGDGFTREKIELIKRIICAGATDDELQLFLYTARRTGLDPLARQIHMVKRWNAKEKREVASIQTGIDGYRLIADRTGKLAGISDAEFDNEEAEHPNKATVTVRKLVNGVAEPFTASARWSEYVQIYKDKDSGKQSPTAMWAKMPFLMLAKCAESLALRKAFPADLSGVYTFEEMGHADNDAKPGTTQTAQGQGQQTQTKKTAPTVQRKSEKAKALPAMGGPAVTNPAAAVAEPSICSECRIEDGHAPSCPYNPEVKARAERNAAREKQWLEYPGHDPEKHISFKQAGLLFVVQGKVGITEDQMKEYLLANLQIEHRPLIPKESFGPLLDAMDPDFKFHEEPKE